MSLLFHALLSLLFDDLAETLRRVSAAAADIRPAAVTRTRGTQETRRTKTKNKA